jgi:hypothetical protein
MKKSKLNFSLLFLFIFYLCIFYQCEKNNKKADEQFVFNFPKIDNVDSIVYNEIKKTCETYWDLSKMIATTFEVVKEGEEYVIQCDGYLDGQLYRFVIRVDKNGKWINDGRSIKE